MFQSTLKLLPILSAILLLPLTATAADQPKFAVEQLKDGGYVVFFRHAKRDQVPSVMTLYHLDLKNSCKPGGALNNQGRDESRRIKTKMKKLGIPAGEVYASPTCRTKQMAKIIFGGKYTVTDGIAPVWINEKEKDKDHYYGELLELLKKPVAPGTNRYFISHGGILNEKTIEMKVTLQQTDAAVFRPDRASPQGFTFLGTIDKDAWR